MLDSDFFNGKRVFVTGHTGFKGSWLCHILAKFGAEVTGYSLPAPTNPNLFEIAKIERDVHSVIGDIRDMAALKKPLMQLIRKLCCILQLSLSCATATRIRVIPMKRM